MSENKHIHLMELSVRTWLIPWSQMRSDPAAASLRSFISIYRRQEEYCYCYQKKKAAGSLKYELGNIPEGSQVLPTDPDLRDPSNHLFMYSTVRITSHGPYRPEAQAEQEYSQSNTCSKVYKHLPVWNLLSMSALRENWGSDLYPSTKHLHQPWRK